MRFSDILAMAVQQGGGAAADPYGPELVVNGGFTTDSDWTLNEGDAPMTISGGKLRAALDINQGTAFQSISLSAGTYRVVFTIDSITDGSVRILIDDNNLGTSRTAPGTYSENIVYASGTLVTVQANPDVLGQAVIDNVSSLTTTS